MSQLTPFWKSVARLCGKYPSLGQSYNWMMGIEIERARNLMSDNESEMRNYRENAYKLQDGIQLKEEEYRDIAESLRDLKETDTLYLQKVSDKAGTKRDIDDLTKQLSDHKQYEMIAFSNLQQSIRNYHQIDNEYRERLRRISYSWSIVWIVFSVGIGTIFAYRTRKRFFDDLDALKTNTKPGHESNSLIDTLHELHHMHMETVHRLDNVKQTLGVLESNNTQITQQWNDISDNVKQTLGVLETNNTQIIQQLNDMAQSKQKEQKTDTDISKRNEKYIWMTAGVIMGIIGHGVLLSFQSIPNHVN